MSRTSTRMAAAYTMVLGAALVFVVAATTATAPAAEGDRPAVTGAHIGAAQHVLLISVDGLHQSDLARYVKNRPDSALAHLVASGVQYTKAATPLPSDSFPGMVGQATGGNPSSTGIYYDDSYNHALLPAGTTPANCASAKPGVEVTYFEQLAKNPRRIDSGQGLSGLPGSILRLTTNPAQLIAPSQLPVDPASCRPVYPHSYLKVNTVFEVARSAGLRTAWSDKHVAYEILNGPSGTGVQDLFTPEINSDAGPTGDWTSNNALTQQYDGYKVQAVINEIRGFDHSGAKAVGTPAIFGMNFQTVSTAEKLPMSDGQPGGYLADGVTPGPVLSKALDYVDAKVGAMVDALAARSLTSTTAIILSAKHGQSPERPSALTRIPDGPIIDGLNAAWHAAKPSGVDPLVAMAIDDDGMLMWLNDRSAAATDFAKGYLLNHSGAGNDINGNPRPYTASGLAQVLAGRAAADYFKVQPGDPRVPDLFGIAQHGVVYTAKKAKIAEHGGANPEDREVPLVVSGGPVRLHHIALPSPVETTQIAPTILRLLGISPGYLQAVRIEHTAVLPLIG